ncbi:MAG: glutathione S-transferase [Rubellimicrobium sp.]|nr:glutathione S-transferase [Rubellimicrobium sp.]
MSGTLIIGNRTHSSWSLRGWLMFARFGLTVQTRLIDFDAGPVDAALADVAPARTVPCWITPEGVAVSDSLAIAEELASRHPDAGHWPADPAARALARTLACEMHSGFGPLRDACPMNLQTAYRSVPVSAEVLADLDRIATIWTHALQRSGGPWLCGAYSAADAFYAPVMTRILGYDLPFPDALRPYLAAHLADPAFREWRGLALAGESVLPRYARPFDLVPWPEA